MSCVFIDNDNGDAFYGNSNSCPNFNIHKNIYKQFVEHTEPILNNIY